MSTLANFKVDDCKLLISFIHLYIITISILLRQMFSSKIVRMLSVDVALKFSIRCMYLKDE